MSPNRRAITRFLARHRRGAAGLCAALAMLSLGLALRPQQLQTVSVAVADRALPTGHRLEPADLRLAQVASAIAPANDTAGSTAELAGRVLAAPVAAGEPIVAARLMSSRLGAWAGSAGTSPLPVRFADPGAVALVDAGQHLDVLAAMGTEPGEGLARAQVVAADVLVLGVVRSDGATDEDTLGNGSGLGSGEAGRSDLVILACTRPQALAIASAEAGSRLSFVILTGAAAPSDQSRL